MLFLTYNEYGTQQYRRKRRCFVMKKDSSNRRKELHAINQRLSGIKNTLRKIEGNIIETKDNREKLENTLYNIEAHIKETKDNKEKLENILVELAEVKQHLAKRNNRQPRRRRDKGEAEVQTAPKKNQATDAEKSSLEALLGNMDFAQIVKLLQNPMVQSMLKNIL
jgi:chromosome segregation ATPase